MSWNVFNIFNTILTFCVRFYIKLRPSYTYYCLLLTKDNLLKVLGYLHLPFHCSLENFTLFNNAFINFTFLASFCFTLAVFMGPGMCEDRVKKVKE